RADRTNVPPPLAHRPLEDRLQFEPLTLALLVVRRDPERGVGLDVLDPVQVLDELRIAERMAAAVAAVDRIVEVRSTATLADPRRTGREPRTGARLVRRADRQLRRHHAVRSEEHTSELQSRENLVCRL